MKKHYVVDTCVMLDDLNAIKILKNGVDNEIYLTETVLRELDGLKKNKRVSYRASAVIRFLEENDELVKIMETPLDILERDILPDDKILRTVLAQEDYKKYTIVSNDRMVIFKSKKFGLNAEYYKESDPYSFGDKPYTGFVNLDEGEDLVENCFYWKDGRLYYNKQGEEKCIDYDNTLWKIKPRHYTQNALMELIKDDNVNLITTDSDAGFGKSFISIAGSLQLSLQEKKFEKIYIFKSNDEIGNKIGYLPGSLDEKMSPYMRSITDILKKLHIIRPANKIFKQGSDINAAIPELNNKKIELLPINYLRGMSFENCIIIFDENQNLSRDEVRTFLSRMGQNCKVICTGDQKQVDNPILNEHNNGINWIKKLCKGKPNYAHITLSGKKSRGPITDLVREVGL
jgi:PhoH-like ATPase